jgi:hypothetical protein
MSVRRGTILLFLENQSRWSADARSLLPPKTEPGAQTDYQRDQKRKRDLGGSAKKPANDEPISTRGTGQRRQAD